MAYDNDIPLSTDLISVSQGEILANFTAIDSGTTGTGIGFARNHVTMTDATNGGLHNRVDYYQAVVSPTISGFISSLYPKTVTNVEVFYKNSTADMQITNSLLAASTGQGMLPGGLLIKCGTGTATTKTYTVTFALAFPTAVLAINTVAIGTDITQSNQPSGATTSQFTMTSSKTNLGYYYIAIGY